MNAVCRSFGRAAADYEAHASVQIAMADWLAEWLPAERAGAALELGAGTGLFTAKIQPWGGGFLASDGSAEMVAKGRSRFPAVRWREMSAESPDEGAWSWIFSSSLLQWTPGPATTLRAWRSALRPGGRVLAGFFVAETLPELRGLLEVGREPLVWRTPWAWRAAFAEAGLRILRDDVAVRSFGFASPRALLRSLHETGAAPHRLVPPSRLLGWLRDRGDAPMRATWTFFRVEAESPRNALRGELI